MTSENLAKHRLDPNIAFWKELKNGADHFEVTKAEVPVIVCDRHYVFGAKAEGEYSARGACPKLIRDPDAESAVAAKASAARAGGPAAKKGSFKKVQTIKVKLRRGANTIKLAKKLGKTGYKIELRPLHKKGKKVKKGKALVIQ